MLGYGGALAIFGAAGWVWALLSFAVFEALGLRIVHVGVGFGPPLYRWAGRRLLLTVRLLFFLGLRPIFDWPTGRGHARRARVFDLCVLAGCVACTLPGVLWLRGGPQLLYLALDAVGVVGMLFVEPTGAVDGRPTLASRLRRPPRAAECDSRGALLRRRVHHAQLLLLRGDVDAAQRQLRALQRLSGTENAEFQLFLEVSSVVDGEHAQAAALCERVTQRAENRQDVRTSYALLGAHFALWAAEAGQLPVEEARQRAREALKLQGNPFGGSLQERMDRVHTLARALGEHPERALRPARALIRRSDLTGPRADAYCTLAVAQERCGLLNEAAATRARARRLAPWLARTNGLSAG